MKKHYSTSFTRFLKANILLLFLFLSFTESYSQSTILEREIQVESKLYSLAEMVIYLDKSYNIDLSYNSVNINENKKVSFKSSNNIPLRDLLSLFLEDVNYELSTIGSNKVLIVIWKKSPLKIISGKVTDGSSGESLSGVLVYINGDNTTTTYTQTDGVFRFSVPSKVDTLNFSFLGYDDFKYPLEGTNSIDVGMHYTNEFTPVVIKTTIQDEFSFHTGSKLIDISSSRFETQLSHENDVVNLIKMESGVQSGNEGENGFTVRGATNDKNLMLIDGVPIHEINHSLGLSSVLFPSTISSMELYKEAAPAKYGGRVGAVLDIKLKNGNENRQEVDFEIDDKHITFSLNGPLIKNKLTYNFFVRESIIDAYLPVVFNSYVKNLDATSTISYGDLLGKMTYKFTPDARLEFLVGYSRDNMVFSKTTEEIVDLNTDFNNSWYWNTKFASARYSQIFSSTFKVEAQISRTSYLNKSGGAYKFYGSDVNGENILNFYSLSDLNNIYANLNFDYYISDAHKLNGGINYHSQSTVSTILQNQEEYNYGLKNSLSSFPKLKSLDGDVISAHLEDVYFLNNNIKFYTGLRVSHFDLINYKFIFLPRFKASYQWNSKLISFLSYSRNAQYSHMLSNSGIGQPIQLYTGSDDRFNPIISNQLSFSNVVDWLESRIELTGYYKTYNNIVDYNVGSNLFAVDYNSVVETVFSNPDQWRYHTSANNSEYSYGVEFSFRKDFNKMSTWLTYAYARHKRRVENFNNGNRILGRYDRPIDINLGFNYKFNDSWAIGTHFIYGSGNMSNVSFELYDSIYGFPHLATAIGSYRLPSYQRLSVYGRYKYSTDKSNLVVNLGVKNIYNRQNVFYLYVYSDSSGDFNVRRVSLFPILPVINFKYSF